MNKTLYGILSVADDDLTALVAAVVHVVKERHYNQDEARQEMEDVVARLRAAVEAESEKSAQCHRLR